MASPTTTDDPEAIREHEGPGDDENVVALNGRSIEDRAEAGEHEEPEAEETGQFTIPGTKPGMSLNAGGKRPTVSEAKLDGITLRLVGQFEKGERVRLVIDAIVRDVQFPDSYDKAGNVVQTRRKHVFKPVAIEPVPIEP